MGMREERKAETGTRTVKMGSDTAAVCVRDRKDKIAGEEKDERARGSMATKRKDQTTETTDDNNMETTIIKAIERVHDTR